MHFQDFTGEVVEQRADLSWVRFLESCICCTVLNLVSCVVSYCYCFDFYYLHYPNTLKSQCTRIPLCWGLYRQSTKTALPAEFAF